MAKQNSRFDPSRYENNLTVFGRKVLNVLMQKWRSDENNRQNFQHASQINRNPTPTKRVLSFREVPSRPLQGTEPIIYQEISLRRELSEDQPFDFNLNQNLHQWNDIPSTSELVRTIDHNPDENIDNIVSRKAYGNDTNILDLGLINPVKDIRILEDTLTTIVDKKDCSLVNKSSDSGKENQIKEVDWENMFDTVLLSDEVAIENGQVELKQIETSVSKTFHIKFPKEITKATETLTKGKCGNSKDDVTKVSKKSKRRNQAVTDHIPDKVKKVSEEPKISFRKQKYTKTVKNWLNDIVSTNTTENMKGEEKNDKNCQVHLIIENAKEKSNKKVVQAQLANKDGIMKFQKPNKESVETHENVSIADNNNQNNNDDEKIETPEKSNISKSNKTPKANKIVKSKSKFVAPIKSQIPIKDIVFQVTILEGDNIDDHIRMLKNIDNQDLVLVVIYSNGFCQLNNQHTENTCDPEGFIFNIDDNFFYVKGDHRVHKETFQTLLEKNKIICYGGKTLLACFKCRLEIDIYKLNIIDIEIGGSILYPDNPPENFSELPERLLSFKPQFTIATECVLQKTSWYITLLRECASKLVQLLVEEEVWDVFINIEMKVLPIITDMESCGVSVDLQKIKSMEEVLMTKMKATELECHKAAGKSFQINSPVQVRALIYDELKLDAKCNVKIRETIAQGAKSTSESMLRGLVSVHPLPRLILEYRHLHKAYSTFLTGIAQHVKDGVVKPTWVQTAAATGRIASNNPNLQAIPKVPFSLRLFPELAEVNDDEQQTLSFRSVYVARAGCRLLACDFQHVECRVFAHAAADRALLHTLRASADLFRALAARWLQKPEPQVSPADRERTKRIVYASLYGAGARTLADILAVSYDQALAVHASFNRTFPSLRSFSSSVRARVAAGARLGTLCGRARRFPRATAAEPAERALAHRQALNHVIQGSAADLCKRAMVSAADGLRAQGAAPGARLLLQLHDELVWEVPEPELRRAAVIIKQAMENCGLESGMEDILPVSMAVGRNWGEMEEYHAQ